MTLNRAPTRGIVTMSRFDPLADLDGHVWLSDKTTSPERLMKRAAFTLIELLVVVAIIATLMAILIPSLKMAREQARDVVCRQRLGEVVRGHLYYATDWRDMLPGNTGNNLINGRETIFFDWLGIGSVGTKNERMSSAPQRGTIFRYLNVEDVYRCPTHRLRHEADTREEQEIEHRSSYTAPAILTGAPLSLLKRVRYPDFVLPAQMIPRLDDAKQVMMPVIVVEEDANWYLVRSDDSAWTNWDRFTLRHRGFGGVGFVDGHAELRRYDYRADRDEGITAWHLLYELTDGRIISAGHWNVNGRSIPMGWLRDAPSDF